MLNMKHVFIAVAMMLLSSPLFAQTKKKATIDHATVFLNGAELESSAKVSLAAGETEVIFTNIAGNVNQQSLNVGATNGAVVQSAVFQNNYLADDNLSPRAQEISDSIEYLNDAKGDLNIELQVVNEQLSVLGQNKKVSGEQSGLSVAELQKMLALVKSQTQQLLSERNTINEKVAKIDKRVVKLNQQLQEEKQKGYTPGGQLLVKFYSPRATPSDITISYVVPNAGWTPSYDVRVAKVNSPVNLSYKAHVYQNSGVSWDKVKLTLSTGNPNEGAQAPTLNPWYLSFNRPVAPKAYGSNAINSNYQRDVVEVSAYKVPLVDKDNASGGINNYVQVDNSGINTQFDIDLKYTIPSDGQTHNVAIKQHQLPATYRYYAVPKLDRDAFLQAQVTDWEGLNLLPGTTNIFYEDTYVGQGYIDMRGVKDTMNISLGRDKKVIIRREREKDLRSVRTIGSNIRESFVYTMSIRNTRNEAINITILDQLPISNDNTIEIEDKKYDGAEMDETTGALKWKLSVDPNTTKKVQVGFTVKYPKGKQINIYR